MIQAAKTIGICSARKIIGAGSVANKSLTCSKQFHSTCYLSLPQENDQEKLLKELEQLEEEWRSIDGEIEELAENIRANQEYYETDGDKTEVSKYVAARKARKDHLIGQFEEERNPALFHRKNPREENSL